MGKKKEAKISVTPSKRLLKIKLAKKVKAQIDGSSEREPNRQVGLVGHHAINKQKTFQELLEEIMPDDFLLREHRDLYNTHRNIKQVIIQTIDDKKIKKACEGFANYSYTKNEEAGCTYILINEVDRQARKDAIELAYKVKGHLSPIKVEVKRDMEDIPDGELLALVQDNDDTPQNDDN